MMNVSPKEMMTRLCKYVIEGFVVALAVWMIPKKQMDIEEVVVIGLTAAATFAILDMFAPSVMVNGVKTGAGFGIGAKLVGWPA
jgi:hypothetical protein